MNSNFIVAFMACVSFSGLLTDVALAQSGPVSEPANLAQGNLLKNPGFDGETCFAEWKPHIQKDRNVICGAGEGTIWLNHNNTIGDPAVTQTVSGLDPSKEYKLEWSWRAGDTAHSYIGSDPKPIMAVKIGDGEIRTFKPNHNITDWKTTSITFVPSSDSVQISFRGEAGELDGDVVIDWATLRPEAVNELPATFNMITYSVGGQARSGEAADDFFLVSEGGRAVIAQGQPMTLHVERLDSGEVLLRNENDEYLSFVDSTHNPDYADLPHQASFVSSKDQAARLNEMGSTVPACENGQTSSAQTLCLTAEEAANFLSLSLEGPANQLDGGPYMLRHHSLNVGLVPVSQFNAEANDTYQTLLADTAWRIQPR